MRKVINLLTILFVLVSLINTVSAQNVDTKTAKRDASLWANALNDPSVNIFTARQAYDIYAKSNGFNEDRAEKERELREGKLEKENAGEVFLRQFNFLGPRCFPSGQRGDVVSGIQEHQKLVREYKNSTKSTSGNWTFVGPNHVTGTVANGSYQSPGGSGRVNCIAVDPTNTSVIWIGTPSGGLWKTTNGGTNWTTTTDQFSVLGVSSIVINPSNTSVMYIATGDGEAGDTYSSGILKSTDGGVSWQTTGLSLTADQKWVIRKIVIDPTNTNKMYAATNKGLLVSTDGFATYTTPVTGTIYDVELKPGTPATVYCVGVTSGATKFYVSTNSGTSFTAAGSGLPTTGAQRVSIAVSAAAPNNVWALAGQSSDQGFYGFFTSTNSGTSFTTTFNSTTAKHNLLGWNTDFSDAGGQAFYDLSLAVNPTNANEIFVGGVNLQKSTNGGTSWTCNGYWLQGSTQQYIHADHHALEYINGTTLFDGCDGGIFKTTNNGSTWTDIGGDLAIAQVARIGVSQLNSSLIIDGEQDNGTNLYTSGTWKIVYGGDGCESVCDPTNQSIMYASYVQGSIYRSTNSGSSWSTISATTSETGSWITPYALDATTNTTIYEGYNNMYKSTNSGSSWTKLGTAPGSGEIISFRVAPSSNSTIYIIKEYWNGSAYVYTVAKSTNATGTSATWTDLSSKLPVTTAAPTAVEVSPTDANKVWITFSGYTSGTKVYYSADGGSTFTNISYNLPNLPVNCVVYQKGSNDATYIGTDVGVYYKDNTMSSWLPFSTGLPNVIVKELEIYYDAANSSNNRLVAATYGRSVWKSDLYAGTVTPTAPTATTVAAGSITSSGSTLNGTVNNNGAASTTVTFEYGTTTSYGSTATATPSSVTGSTSTSVTAAITGLAANTTYHFRVKAVNSVGTTYGSDMTFTTSSSATAPTATTVAAGSITSSGATLNGSVNNNNAASTTVTFEYGTTTSYGSTATATPSSVTGSTSTSVTAAITGLAANTTYHFRVKAVNSVGTTYGSDMTFTTSSSATAPTATTVAAGSITSSGSTLNGTVNNNGAASTTVTFEYGTTTSYGSTATATPSSVTGSTNTSVTASITGLAASTTYHFRVKAVNSVGTTYGSDMTFTTGTVTTGAAIPFSEAFAASTLPTGWTTSNTGTGITERWSVSNTANAGGSAYEMKCTYQNLNPGTTMLITPALNTSGMSSIILNAKYMLDDYGAGATIKVQVSKDKTTWTDVSGWSLTTAANSNRSGSITNLSIPVSATNTYVAFVITGNLYQFDYFYLDNVAITTSGTVTPTAPTATTVAASSITSTGAKLNGTVNNNNAASTTVTFEYGTTTSYGSTASAGTVTGSTSTAVSATLTGLAANTTYHFRVKAVNSVGTTYGTDMTFTTSASATAPTATTVAASSITSSGATLNGSVNNNNAASTTVTFEYGTTTSYGSTATATPSSVTGSTNTSVSASITGLAANTTYHFRVKAVNSVGTTYGTDMSFTTTNTTITYCASKGTSQSYEWLDYFALGTLTNTTSKNSGYGDFTSMTAPTLALGSSQTVYFSAAFTSTAYTEYFKVYIDYNHNGVFTDAGETVASGSSSSTGNLSATFTVPTSALTGTTRCRIVMSDNSATTSCGTYSYGETEDYTVNISATGAKSSILFAGQTEQLEPLTVEYIGLYPVPASTYITVKVQSQNVSANATIYNLKGQVVKSQILNSNEQTIDISNLPSGSYMLIYNDGAKQYTKNFIKE